MEAYRIDRFGSVDGIVLRSSEDPRPGLKEVLMRVRASSLNYRDLMALKGGGRGPTKIGVGDGPEGVHAGLGKTRQPSSRALFLRTRSDTSAASWASQRTVSRWTR